MRTLLIRRSLFAALLVPAALGTFGCRSVGPVTVSRDRLNYSGALADSWKRQMLLNIVKTRYIDPPVYLDVGQIVSGYTLETSASLGGSVNNGSAPGALGNSLALGGAARFADSPTITYTPLMGEPFREGFLSPIDPARIFSLVRAGYAADFILELTLDSFNGLRNQPVAFALKRQADPDFYRVLTLLRGIQDDAALEVRVERPSDGKPETVLSLRGDDARPELQAEIREVQQRLGLRPDQSAFKIVTSPSPGGTGEVAVATRSLSQVIAALALGVEVPPRHVDRRLTPPVSLALAAHEPLLRVHGGPDEPTGAFVAVPYEGQWFWIANDDWRSKRTFSSILFLFTLANTGASQNLPTITIPAQ